MMEIATREEGVGVANYDVKDITLADNGKKRIEFQLMRIFAGLGVISPRVLR